MSYCRYHPSKGYWWHFKDQEERGKIFEAPDFKIYPSLFLRNYTIGLGLYTSVKFS